MNGPGKRQQSWQQLAYNSGHLSELPEPVETRIDLPLYALSEREREHIISVLEKSNMSDKKVQKHARELKNALNQLKNPLLSRGRQLKANHLCAMCGSRPATGDFGASCCICRENICLSCSKVLPTTVSNEWCCNLCSLERQILLSSGGWRSKTWKYITRTDGKTGLDGFGLIMIAGLLGDGGVRRTFVIDTEPGGAAEKIGIKPGDEILRWDVEDIVGLSYKSVVEVLRRSSCQSVHMKFRRYFLDSPPFEAEAYLENKQTQGRTFASSALREMLANPGKLGVAHGVQDLEQLATGHGNIYPCGRVKLRLSSNQSAVLHHLNVSVLMAEQLPPVKAGVLPSAFARVELILAETGRVLSQYETPIVMKTSQPRWQKEFKFPPIKVHLELLKVTVFSQKWPAFLGHMQLGEVTILLNEALLDDTPQWYALQPPPGSQLCRFSPSLSDSVMREIRCRHLERPTQKKLKRANALPTAQSPSRDTDDSKAALDLSYSLNSNSCIGLLAAATVRTTGDYGLMMAASNVNAADSDSARLACDSGVFQSSFDSDSGGWEEINLSELYRPSVSKTASLPTAVMRTVSPVKLDFGPASDDDDYKGNIAKALSKTPTLDSTFNYSILAQAGDARRASTSSSRVNPSEKETLDVDKAVAQYLKEKNAKEKAAAAREKKAAEKEKKEATKEKTKTAAGDGSSAFTGWLKTKSPTANRLLPHGQEEDLGAVSDTEVIDTKHSRLRRRGGVRGQSRSSGQRQLRPHANTSPAPDSDTEILSSTNSTQSLFTHKQREPFKTSNHRNSFQTLGQYSYRSSVPTISAPEVDALRKRAHTTLGRMKTMPN